MLIVVLGGKQLVTIPFVVGDSELGNPLNLLCSGGQ